LDNEVPEFCVGQQVTFKLVGLPGVVDMKGGWSLPQKYVNRSRQQGELIGDAWVTYGSVNYDIDSNLLRDRVQTSCWFVKGGGHVSVGMNLKFENGQTASVAANGDISIYRPSANPGVYHGPFGAGIMENYFGLVNNAMSLDVTINSKYPGSFGLTQLVKFYAFPGSPGRTTYGDFWADGGEYYDGPKDKDRQCSIFDAPGVPLGVPLYASYDGHWKVYVRFTPSGCNSIPVTLTRIDWNWIADAVQPSITAPWGVWTDHADNSTNLVDDSFPEWTVSRPGPSEDNQ
jgi:hypothetical protein